MADDAGTQPTQEPPADRTPQRISGAVTDQPPISDRVLIPPYMSETRGDVRTHALFPFYFDRKAQGNHARLVTPYYYKRSTDLNVDVAAGLVWSLRGKDRNSFAIPPFYMHKDAKDWGTAVFPLFSTGRYDQRFHLAIPALLTWYDAKDKDHHGIFGPYFDFKKGERTFRGVFPLLWSRKDPDDRFTMVPPLFFRWADDDPLKMTTIVPPFYHARRAEETYFGLAPLFFRKKSPTEKITTVPLTLFQYARTEEQFRLVTPLLVYMDDVKEGRTVITPLYQRKRGDKNYDGVLPLFFRSWDDRDMSDGLFLPPFYFRMRDPANDMFTLLPFFGRYQHDGVSNTWVTPLVGRYKSFEVDAQTWWFPPTFAYGWDQISTHFNIHPLFYWRRGEDKSHLAISPLWYDFQNHEKGTRRTVQLPFYWNFRDEKADSRALVVPPLYWDFKNGRKNTRNIVGFPLYWDFRKPNLEKRTAVAFPLYTYTKRGDTERHFALNTMVERTGKPEKRTGYAVHFFPLTAWGKNETGRWWSLFYGLAGYERRGEHKRITAFWIPFEY